ncbi:MAG: hypothetical protein J0H79_14170 [Alphaproteobacteria bacterium]|nr:hypothetical protein [Alphaproteobacteria bacterium]OJU57334.1 MAG: hypothetical protein BGO00_04550 [Alphaproteobacteria bacterium 62-8]
MTVAVMRSGARIVRAAPRVEAIRATDIAEHLAKQVMYGGATWGYYSKAQHAILVATEIAREEGALGAFYALLKDATDAFGAELPRERNPIIRAVYHAFDLDAPMPKPVQAALLVATANVALTERRQLLTGCDDEVSALEAQGAKPLRGMIRPLAWDRAMDRYIDALRINAAAAQLDQRRPVWEGIA